MRVSGFVKVLVVLWTVSPVGAVFLLVRLKRHRQRIDQGDLLEGIPPEECGQCEKTGGDQEPPPSVPRTTQAP